MSHTELQVTAIHQQIQQCASRDREKLTLQASKHEYQQESTSGPS